MSAAPAPHPAHVVPPAATTCCSPPAAGPGDLDAAVASRYSAAARQPAPSLCCPSTSGPDPALLANIPEDVVARDYGCGDPTRHLAAGESVLDLGSGSGKACFLAAQIVGPAGRVTGVDRNDDMLALARRAQPEVARRIGYDNVRFVKARIEDLALDREALDRRLSAHPVSSEAGLAVLERWMAERRTFAPAVPDGSVDAVISNCVLNLVLPGARERLFAELFRVLRPGARAVISDVVVDRDVPEHLQRDPELWSGCLSGAFREDLFLQAFRDAGFGEVTLLARSAEPWQQIEGLQFRSVTVRAVKGTTAAHGARGAQSAVSAASSSCCEGTSCC